MEKKREKSINESNRSALRRMRTPVVSLLSVFVVALWGIPLYFNIAHPVVPYSDIDLPSSPLEPSSLTADAPVENAPIVISETTQMAQEAIIEPIKAKTTSLALDDEDPKVAEIQLRLMELGYMDGDEPTEKFGEQTQEALRRFQRTHYMAQTGIADELTQSILFSDSAKIYSLEAGNQGDDVEKLQKQLVDLGYYTDKVNGYFGVGTSRALSAFQTKNKLDASGAADGDTLDILYSAQARPKIDPTPTPKPKPTKTPKPAKTPRDNGTSISTDAPTTINVPSSIATVGSGLDAFINVAMQQEGKPYSYSNEGPDSFDCSGLVYYSLKSVGVSVGRMSAKHFATIENWQTVPTKDMLIRGDLLFFTNSAGSGTIGHTGIYLGNDKFIHASSSAGRVVVSTWSPWCVTNFQWGKRVF